MASNDTFHCNNDSQSATQYTSQNYRSVSPSGEVMFRLDNEYGSGDFELRDNFVCKEVFEGEINALKENITELVTLIKEGFIGNNNNSNQCVNDHDRSQDKPKGCESSSNIERANNSFSGVGKMNLNSSNNPGSFCLIQLLVARYRP